MKKVVCLLTLTLLLAWTVPGTSDLAPIKKAMVGYLALMSSLLATIIAEDFARALPVA